MKNHFLFILYTFNILNSQPIMDDINLKYGTTVIAFLKDDIGWIVADSKVNLVTNGITTGTEYVRKIKHTNDIYYAFTVHPIMHFNDELIYDAFSIMESVIEVEVDFDQSFVSFDNLITNKLNEVIKILQKSNRISTLEKYTNTSFLGFLMVQYENKKPKYQIRSYKFKKIGTEYITIIDPPLILGGAYPMLFLGSRDAAINYIKSNPTLLVGFQNIKDKLVCLVSKEIEANSEHVGYPIDAVEITNNGAIWDYNIYECPIKD